MPKNLKWNLAQFFELIWWKKYLKKKPVKDYTTWKDNYWRTFLVKIEGEKYLGGSKRVLDAGCGPAGIFRILEKHKVTAIDPLLDRYTSSIPHFNKKNHPEIDFYQSEIETFSSNVKFEIVFCLNVLNHVKNLSRAIDNLASLCEESGYLIISTDNHRHKFFKILFTVFPFDVLHPHQYTRDEYVNFFLRTNKLTLVEAIPMERHVMFDYEVLIFQRNCQG